MKKLLGLVLFCASLSFGATVTCNDGRVIGLTPFNQYTPKEVLCGEVAEAPTIPPIATESFLKIFGPAPKASDYSNYRTFQQARDLWNQDLKWFKGTGLPEGINPVELKAASDVFAAWGLNECFPYEGRYGWFVRCPKATFVPGIEFPLHSVLSSPHNLVASYQQLAVSIGYSFTKEQCHPYLPPQLCKLEEAK